MKDDAKGLIEVRDLGVVFGEDETALEAVPHVSMTVNPGEFVSLIGPSGCGKSTLLNIAAGFLLPSSGAVLIDGKAVDGPGADRGVVFQ